MAGLVFMECEMGGLFSFSSLVHASKWILEISPFTLTKKKQAI